MLYICFMKYLFTLVVFLCLSAPRAQSQIINGGFEEWTGNQPNGWSVEGFDSRKSSRQTGGFCYGYISVYFQPANVLNGKFTITPGVKGLSFWYSANYTQETPLHFFYSTKFHGAASKLITLPISDWTKYNVNFTEPNDSTALLLDSIIIIFSTVNNELQTGGISFWVDDVTFETLRNEVSNSKTKEISLDIFPNPITNLATLRYHLASNATIIASIFDLTGRKVLKLPTVSSTSETGSIPFDCDNLPNGMYYLRFETGETVLMRKIIVQH